LNEKVCWCGVTIEPDPLLPEERKDFFDKEGIEFCRVGWCCVAEQKWEEINWTDEDASV